MNKSFTTSRFSWPIAAEEVSRRLGRRYSGAYCREVATGFRNSKTVRPILEELGLVDEKNRLLTTVNVVMCDKKTTEDAHSHLLRQRLTLARHLRGANLALRSARQELTEAHDRLAATSTKLGETMRDKLALEARLQLERETSARLDLVVRRLAARPRIKRTTTHVEIAGMVFRNRTTKAVTA